MARHRQPARPAIFLAAKPKSRVEIREIVNQFIQWIGRVFQRRTRIGPQASFPYLASSDGQQPQVERCCAKILLSHGERMPDGAFVCPVCGTEWQRSAERLHGLRVAIFRKPGLAEPLAIQPGRTRPFLVSLSEYSPPRE